MKKSQKVAEAINGMTYKEWESCKQVIEAEFERIRKSNVLTIDDRVLGNIGDDL